MQLVDVVRDLDTQAQDDGDLETIFVRRPWAPESDAIVAPLTEDGRVPPTVSAAGFEYFLEIPVAREVLEFWSNPSALDRCNRLIEYAINDA